MKNHEQVIGEAKRIEFDKSSNRLYIVFEIRDELQKQFIKKNWTHSDVEFRIIDKFLVKNDE
jgi:hypothetical protein